MEKRTLLALALSFAVLGLYPVVLQKMYPDYYKKAALKSSVKRSATEAASSRPTGSASSAPSGAVPAVALKEDVQVANDRMRLTFNTAGGGIREAVLLDFNDALDRPLTIFSLDDAASAPSAVRLIGASPEVPEFSITTQGQEITAVSKGGDIRVTKHYTLQGNSLGLQVQLQNTSAQALSFQYQLVTGPSFPHKTKIDSQYIEGNFYTSVDGKRSLRHVRESKVGHRSDSQGALEWSAAKDRHFSVIVKGGQNERTFVGTVEGLPDRNFRVYETSPSILLQPGGSITHDFLLYIGPNDMQRLAPLGLESIVSFGKLDAIAKVLIGVLEMLHRPFRNYGLAIIAFTMLLNLLLFPLTRVSYMSMKRMQLIQPQMNKLRDQHKKNPEKLNKEMMELYKKHKVNPFGGCLPMFLQMPVFIALYVAFCKMTALIGEHFLWIKDLSSPDRVPLPVSLPLFGNELHILPLVLVAIMALQQRFTQIKMQGQDPAMESQQKMMAFMMPIFLGLVYTMPSGYVLYFLVNSLLMTLYQLHLKKMTLVEG